MQSKSKYKQFLGDVNFHTFYKLTNIGRHKKEINSIFHHNNSVESMLYRSTTSSSDFLLKKQKKVTFEDDVLKGSCSVENLEKSSFNNTRQNGCLPNYAEFMAMKNNQIKNSKEVKTSTPNQDQIIYAPLVYRREAPSEIIFHKVDNSNSIKNNRDNMTENKEYEKVRITHKYVREKPSFNLVKPLISIPSSPNNLLDEGYSTCSQNTPKSPLCPLTLANTKTPSASNFHKNKKDSLSKSEIKELNALLTDFGEENIECSETSSSEDVPQITVIEEEINEIKNSLNKIHNQSNEKANDRNVSVDLKDAVNELFSVGNCNSDNNTRTENIEPEESLNLKWDSIEKFFSESKIFNELESCADPFFLIEVSSSTYESSDVSLSEGCQGNDSGIDETMPGLTKDSSARSNRSSERRSKSSHKGKSREYDRDKDVEQDKKEPSRNRYNKENDVRHVILRTQSGTRKSKKQQNNVRFDSLPSTKSHNSELTVNVKSRNTLESNERNGRSRERRSEPTISSKRPVSYDKQKGKRRSELIKKDITETKESNNNNNKKSSKTKSYRSSSKSPPKVVIPPAASSKQKEINLNPQDGMNLQRNNSLHISGSRNEIMWDTADGKHRVYVRSKNNEPGPLPKKETIDDRNIRGLMKGDSSDLIDELDVSPEIINMLKEEEKFWQEQQELKQWRESRDRSKKVSRPNTKDKYSRHNIGNNRHNTNYHKSIEHDRKEKLREEEEDRMSRESERLMRIRAQQEYMLKTSKENLLREENEKALQGRKGKSYDSNYFNYSPKNIRHSNYEQQIRNTSYNSTQSSPTTHNSTHPHRVPQNPSYWNHVTQDYDHSKHPSHNLAYSKHTPYEQRPDSPLRTNKTMHDSKESSYHRHHKNKARDREDVIIPKNEIPLRNGPNSYESKSNSPDKLDGVTNNRWKSDKSKERTASGYLSPDSDPIYERSKNSIVNYLQRKPNTGCFSDNDEVFYEKRRQNQTAEVDDNRGYFSDQDAFSKNVAAHTYQARPLVMRQKINIRCTACCKVITSERLMNIEGQDYYWHLKCFFCVVCRAYLNDQHTIRVRIVNYKLHCRYCYSVQSGEQLSEV